MRHLFLAPAFALALSVTGAPAAASNQGWDDASTVVDAALVAAAIGIPLAKGDGNGAVQAGASVGVAYGAATGLKYIFPETRPDGSDRRSFPSGHTSAAFAAAASIQQRQGWGAGIPAHIAAAFVGYARVEAKRHHWYDVVAGAAIGEASGLLITNDRHRNVAVMPWGDTRGGGIAVAARF